jgi:phosphatidylethanolamine/phosphatidyl-N-methylethanolamine N-methyltransferase
MKRKETRKKGESLGDKLERTFKEGLSKLRAVAEEKKARRKTDREGPFFYLETFLKDRMVATVSPSTAFVIRKLIKALDLKGVEVLVEFGPADGVITKELLKALPPDSRLVAIERNPDFHRKLSAIKDPRLIPVLGDVRDTRTLLKERGITKVDRVVSGIPFSFLTDWERGELLRSITSLLKTDGRFVAYQFTTHLIPLLKGHFRHVDIGFEIRNIPPFFIFTCKK